MMDHTTYVALAIASISLSGIIIGFWIASPSSNRMIRLLRLLTSVLCGLHVYNCAMLFKRVTWR